MGLLPPQHQYRQVPQSLESSWVWIHLVKSEFSSPMRTFCPKWWLSGVHLLLTNKNACNPAELHRFVYSALFSCISFHMMISQTTDFHFICKTTVSTVGPFSFYVHSFGFSSFKHLDQEELNIFKPTVKGYFLPISCFRCFIFENNLQGCQRNYLYIVYLFAVSDHQDEI